MYPHSENHFCTLLDGTCPRWKCYYRLTSAFLWELRSSVVGFPPLGDQILLQGFSLSEVWFYSFLMGSAPARKRIRIQLYFRNFLLSKTQSMAGISPHLEMRHAGNTVGQITTPLGDCMQSSFEHLSNRNRSPEHTYASEQNKQRQIRQDLNTHLHFYSKIAFITKFFWLYPFSHILTSYKSDTRFITCLCLLFWKRNIDKHILTRTRRT